MEFVGKVALFTGGSRGIGKSIAAVFTQEGAAVAIAYATRAQDAEGVVSAFGRRDGARWRCTPMSARPAMSRP